MTSAQTIKAHLPVLVDYIGLAAAIALIVYASQTLGSERCSPIVAVVYASLVIGHLLFPIPRRTPVLYGVLLTIGIVSTIYYALDIVHEECGYQVIIGRPRDLHLPEHGNITLPADPWLQCTDVAGAFWLNLIVTGTLMDAFDFQILKRKRVPVPLKQIKLNLAPHENEVRVTLYGDGLYKYLVGK